MAISVPSSVAVRPQSLGYLLSDPLENACLSNLDVDCVLSHICIPVSNSSCWLICLTGHSPNVCLWPLHPLSSHPHAVLRINGNVSHTQQCGVHPRRNLLSPHLFVTKLGQSYRLLSKSLPWLCPHRFASLFPCHHPLSLGMLQKLLFFFPSWLTFLLFVLSLLSVIFPT